MGWTGIYASQAEMTVSDTDTSGVDAFWICAGAGFGETDDGTHMEVDH